MAEIIPEFLPDSATAGERRVFATLQRLPDDVVVYYEPIIRRRFPDFVVILPSVGVVVVEVKSIPLPWITRVDWHELHYTQGGNPQVQQHPARQARAYMNRLMQACNDHPRGGELKRGGHFAVAFGYLTILTSITRGDLDESPWAEFFPRGASLCSDELNDAALTSDTLVSAFRNAVDPELPRASVSSDRVELLRAIISPPARLPPSSNTPKAQSVALLDIEQEKAARSIGSGHRILYGVPGSGKTVILIAIAKMLAEAEKSVLFLCYNRSLNAYLVDALAPYSHIKVETFGHWAMRQGAPKAESEDAFGEGLLSIVGKGGGEAGKYDAVLIDEAQDFWPSWFKCAVNALSEPVSGTVVVAYDLSQMLYGVALPKWSLVGIQARGRTRRFRRNYRNTKEIVVAAGSFGIAESGVDDDVPQATLMFAANCIRSGPPPAILQLSNRDAQLQACVGAVKQLIAGNFQAGGQSLHARANEIMVLCKTRADADRLSDELKTAGPEVKVSTIHSARGLQAKAVVLFGAEDLQHDRDRALMYVALTRPTDVLVVLWSADTPLIKELVRNTTGTGKA